MKIFLLFHLPFNISSELVIKWCKIKTRIIALIVWFNVSKELAERIVAEKIQKNLGDYQFYAMLFSIKRNF